MLTVLLSVLVICVHSCNSDGGRGKGAAWTRSGGSEGSGRGAAWTRSGGSEGSGRGEAWTRSSYSGYKAKKGGSTLKKAAAIGATAFVGYQVSFIQMENARLAAGCREWHQDAYVKNSNHF